MAILSPFGLQSLGNPFGGIETTGFDILLETGDKILAEDSAILRQE